MKEFQDYRRRKEKDLSRLRQDRARLQQGQITNWIGNWWHLLVYLFVHLSVQCSIDAWTVTIHLATWHVPRHVHKQLLHCSVLSIHAMHRFFNPHSSICLILPSIHLSILWRGASNVFLCHYADKSPGHTRLGMTLDLMWFGSGSGCGLADVVWLDHVHST